MNKDISNLTENYGHVSTIYEKMGDYKMPEVSEARPDNA
jgi:hypothetical protein